MTKRYPVQPALASHDGRAIKQSLTGAACPVGWRIIEIDGQSYYVKEFVS